MPQFSRTPVWKEIVQPSGQPLRQRILVVEDQEIFRRSVSDLLNRHGIETIAAESGEAALALARSEAYIALGIIDILMPEADIEGIEAARILTREFAIPCLMLTSVVEAGSRAAAALAGALGYLVKDVVNDAAILAGVKAALAGDPIPDPLAGLQIDRAEALAIRQREQRLKVAYTGLTPRQQEVATLMAQGLTNEQIAERLVVSVATVNTHVQEVLAKLDLRSRKKLLGLTFSQRVCSNPSQTAK